VLRAWRRMTGSCSRLRPLLGFCVDPIEKEATEPHSARNSSIVLRHRRVQPDVQILPELGHLKARELDRLQDAASPEDIVEASIATGSRSIAYTYNDPVIFLEYAVDVARVARRRGIKNVAVTAGYIDAAAREELLHLHDAANVDLKAFTGVLQAAVHRPSRRRLETLEYLKYRTKVWLEITTLLIPVNNDSRRR